MCEEGSADERAISSFIGSVVEECFRFWQAGVETNTVSQMSEADRVCVSVGDALLDEFGVVPEPFQALPREAHQFSHATGVEDQRAHRLVQLAEELCAQRQTQEKNKS